MNNLGYMYEQAWGFDRNYDRARYWYEKASSAGNSTAMINLGRLYQDGLGVPKDYSQARQWYERAAKAGDGDAAGKIQLLPKP
jgi:TPR repeat protein